MVAPPIAQVVHTMLAQALFAPPSLSASSREPRRERGEYRDSDAGPERHGKGGGDTCPEQALRQGKDKNEDRTGARPDADREHHSHYLSP